jgi:hypothetical protein
MGDTGWLNTNDCIEKLEVLKQVQSDKIRVVRVKFSRQPQPSQTAQIGFACGV